MATYLHLFDTEAEYNTARNNDYTEPWVSTTNIGGSTSSSYRVDYNKSENEKLLETPLTFEIISGGTIYYKLMDEYSTPKTIEYRKNNGEWTEITSDEEVNDGGATINVSVGDTVQFRGDIEYSYYGNLLGSTTCKFNMYGNIMSLVYSDEFCTNMTLTEEKENVFSHLFEGSTGLISAANLILPSSIVPSQAYSSMFQNCSGLIASPELPGTTLLGEGNYNGMFKGCNSLINGPSILPATTVSADCYHDMFAGCTSLTQAPELPATTLSYQCYYSMFNGCTNLNYIKCLATDISNSVCTSQWVEGVQTTSGTFVKASDADWSIKTGYDGIPSNWTVQNAE